jgi:hypothetical protein
LRNVFPFPSAPTQSLGALQIATASPPSAAADQRIILVIGVDALKAPSQLRAVWYITYRTPGNNLFLLGLPVDLTPEPESSLDLRATFQWTADAGLNPGFLAGLHHVIPFDLDAVIILDDQGFASLIDYLGGLELEGSVLNGKDISALQALLAADPAASLSTQAEILKALAARSAVVGSTPDLTPLISLLPDHAWSSRSVSELVALAAPLLPLDPNLIHIDIY